MAHVKAALAEYIGPFLPEYEDETVSPTVRR